MKERRSLQEKQEVADRYWRGEPAASLCAQYGIPRSTLYSWLKPYKKLTSSDPDRPSVITQKEFADLKRHSEKQAQILQALRLSACTPAAPLEERLHAFYALREQFSAHVLCEAFNISRGTYYNRILHQKNPTVNERHSKEIRERVKAVFEQSEQRYGADKILAVLEEDGIPTSKRLVSRIMREEGLQSIRVHAKSDYEGLAPKRNLVQCHFQADAPNMIWVSDVTCLKINQSTQYVCVILDLFSRKVLSFRISTCNSTQLITSAFKEAFCLRGRPAGLTFHSDQGTQYTAVAFRRLLKKCGVAQSFSHSGRPTDNAVAEAFFSSMKREELYRRNYRSEKDFRDSVAAYIHFYNTERPHRSNDYHSPDYVERECRRAHK